MVLPGEKDLDLAVELVPDLAKLNQFVTGSLIIASVSIPAAKCAMLCVRGVAMAGRHLLGRGAHAAGFRGRRTII